MSIVSRPKPVVTTTVATNFSPKDINGCQLWLDAADVNSFTLSGNTLQSIQDKSAIGNSITVASAPTYNATGFNSNPCFVFAGGNSITCPLSGVTTQDIMMVAVWKQTQNSMSSPFSMGSSGSGGEIGLLWHSGEGRYLSYTYGAGDSHNSSVSYNVNVIQVGIKISSVMSCWINGTVGDTVNSGRGNTANTIYIGGGSWPMVGQLAEIIFYVGTVNNTQRQQVEGYLAQKWGLTSSLPPGHPGLTQTLYGIVTTTVSIPVSISFTLVPYYLKYTLPNTNCILWLDASDRTTLYSDAAGTTLATAGGTVGYWKDKSASGFNAIQSASSYRPTYILSGRNGKSVLSFNEVTNFLNIPQFTAVPLTIFFVAQASTFLSNMYFLSLGAAGATVKLRALSTYGVDGITAITTTNADTNWHLWTLTISNTTATFYFDGSLVGTSSWSLGSSYTFATNTIASLNQQVAGQATTIIMPEILFYNVVLSTTQQQQVESYLASKWSIMSQLPQGHINFSQPAGVPTSVFQRSIISVPKFISV